MKRPCAWCAVKPAVYSDTDYCSYHCWENSLRAIQGEIVEEETLDPEPQGSKQLDLLEKLIHTL
jgi:hypothetical protein